MSASDKGGRESLARLATSGTAWSFVASLGQQAIAFVVFVILARQLGPVEFGVVALANVFLDLLILVGRGGLTEVLIQRDRLDETEKSTAFWSSLCLGSAGTLAIWFGAGAAARYFDTPGMVPVMHGLALVCMLNALGTVQEAELKRDFGFKALAMRTLLATCVSGIAAVAAAYAGWGAMSLVVQRLVATLLLTGILWYAVRWVPKLTFSLSAASRQLRMGSAICGSSLLGVGNQRVIDVVIGRMLGATPLGYLRIAWRALDLLMELGLRPIQQVTLPAFSRLQNDAGALRAAYLRTARVTAIVIYPVFIGAAIVAPDLITLVFGAQWGPSVPLMQILALGVLVMPLIWFKSNVLLAIGRVRAVMLLNIVEFALSVAVVTISCRWGVTGAAWGNVIRLCLAVLPIWWVLHRYLGIELMPFFASQWQAATCTALMVIATFLVGLLCPGLPAVVRIAVVITVGAVVYFAALFLLHRQAWNELVDLAPRPARSLLARLGLAQRG
ncbi:lipopolysaccharide biosynthesis protein [Pseudoxanthomonas composti]|uniref:Lipopolysaccharide biosynthesis protein n=1 Tax=Pseudoxanthomonas composti TaxID=2137479 RepID=A0A4Q1JY45_9GAMM|nr:lipopolysaccharide biosynthesis protein [Pseudoxanthomonas composti]RXR06344.1 lipopolysaccharide biosynthesis protein [Pseudoxanthomonas composti]